MGLGDFFWMDADKFAAELLMASDEELMHGNKHNVRKRKGGKLGAWAGALQVPMTAGVSLFGTAISVRNRNIAKRRLDMIYAEQARRGLPQYVETWKDGAFAGFAVGTGMIAGQGFVPGLEFGVQETAAAGMTDTATYLAGLAASQGIQNVGSLATETVAGETASKYSESEAWHGKHKTLASLRPERT